MTMKEFIKKLAELDERVTVLEAAKTLAAAPPAEPTPTEELPGMNDLDEFKPDSFKGDAPGVTAADGPPKHIKETLEEMDGDPFAGDGVEMTEEQLASLEEDLDEDDDEVLDENFYDCPSCGGTNCINRTMKRCPECQNYLDWSDEVV